MGRSVESASIWVRQYGADKVEAGKRSIDHYRAAKMLGTEVLMTRISFLYPNRKDARFDIDSYVEEHMPLSIALLSAHPCFKRVSVERGVSGVAPGLGPAYVAVCHFLFESLNDFMAAVTLNLAALQAEKNYTDLEPTFQVSEVPICR